MKKRIAKLLPALGLIVLAATFIINHYLRPGDFAGGLLSGIAIGLIIVGIVLQVRSRRTY
jgi:hypothetical protein